MDSLNNLVSSIGTAVAINTTENVPEQPIQPLAPAKAIKIKVPKRGRIPVKPAETEELPKLGTDAMDTESRILNYLADKPSDTMNFDFPDPLSGIIDLSILERQGYDSIQWISFPPGKITGLINFPKYLDTLKCPNNLLTSIEIPSSLTYLDITKNQISVVNSEPDSKLEVLKCSENRLNEHGLQYKHFPKLSELYLNQNEFTKIDLSAFESLAVLECIGNENLALENVSDTTHILMDKSQEESPKDSKEGSADDSNTIHPKISYEEAVLQYFQLLGKYEKKVKMQVKKYKNSLLRAKTRVSEMAEQIRTFRETNLKCIKCQKKGLGTIFSQHMGSYTAKCGAAKNPCDLNIVLENHGDGMSVQDLLEYHGDGKEAYSQKVLQMKCNAIYSYMKEEDITKKFEKLLDEYTYDFEMYKNNKRIYQEAFARPEDVQSKAMELNQAKETFRYMLKDYELQSDAQRKETMDEAIEQRNKIVEIASVLQNLMYDTREMDKITDGLSKFQYNQIFKEYASLKKLNSVDVQTKVKAFVR
jgi:hypothetical protein